MDEEIIYNSSNIHYLNSIWQTIVDEGNNVCGVFKKFKYIAEAINDNDPLNNANINEDNISYAEYNSVPRKHRTADGKFKKAELIVDIVCDDGLRWIKVKTSNPYSMQMQFINCGSSSKGKNIVTMADNFITASNQHQVYFQSPKIQFVFVEGITSDLAYILKQKHIIIKGKEIKEDFLYEDDDDEDQSQEDETETKDNDDNDTDNGSTENVSLDESCVNLGVRTMLTMISALANDEINEGFFDELQDSLYEKQQDIINAMFSKNDDENDNDNDDNDDNGNDGNDGNDGNKQNKKKKKKKKKKPWKKTTIKNLDFEYCDYPNSNLNSSNKKSLNNKPKKDESEEIKDDDNRFTADGYTIGHKQKLKISSTLRRKRFSEKSYEEQKMLLQMYIDERQDPVLPQITRHIENKKLICCEAAWNHFMDIVNLSAGQNEWKRCKELQSKITIVNDKISERTKGLNGKSMSHINKCVFGTGDSLKVMTISAIASFVRKAEQQGIKYFAHIHPVRPLTERYQTEYEKKVKENEIESKNDDDDEEDHLNDPKNNLNGSNHLQQQDTNNENEQEINNIEDQVEDDEIDDDNLTVID